MPLYPDRNAFSLACADAVVLYLSMRALILNLPMRISTDLTVQAPFTNRRDVTYSRGNEKNANNTCRVDRVLRPSRAGCGRGCRDRRCFLRLAGTGGYFEHARELVMHTLALIGVNYKYGGGSPDSGFDCQRPGQPTCSRKSLA